MGCAFQFGSWWVSHTPQDTSATVASPLKAIGWCKDLQEEDYLFHKILRDHFQWIESGDMTQLKPSAFLRLESAPEDRRVIGFVAMWFNPSVRFIYEQAIEKAVVDAGYEPLRIDNKEHNKKIDDEIVANIRSAKFVVADLTGHRGGVYYEAGLAHGLGLEVIFTCKAGRATHFDIRQYNTIYWNPNAMDDFRSKIRSRILASSIGKGPLDPGRLR